MLIRILSALAIAAAALAAEAADPVLPSAMLKASIAGAELAVAPADVRALVGEDSKALGRPMRYGMPQRVDRPLIAHGRAAIGAWHPFDDGRQLWSATIASAGAVSLDLHFSRFVLPAGAEVYLADRDGTYVLGPIRGSDALADGQYYTALIPGDAMRVEVLVPARERGRVELQLASVTYGYRGLFGRADHPEVIRSGSCNVDVACPLGNDWQDQIDGVGQYIFQDGGSFVCSGTLIGNTAGTATPYFLTADHCVGNNTVAQTMRVYWNYESPTCRAPGSPASGTPLPRPGTFNNGATQRANYVPTDVSLVELNAPVPPAENPFYVGWDRRNLATSGNPAVSSAITIHHPQGHEKRISLEADPLTVTSYLSNTPNASGTHYRIADWDEGTTEGGSSGSSLYNPDQRLIGVLTGGFAACGNDDPDWYGRIHQAWAGGGTSATRLSNWLDPIATAAETLDGYRGEPAGEADVAIALSDAPDPVNLGDTLTYTVDVDNAGPDPATGVQVVLTLPAGVDFDSGAGTGWSCVAAGASVTCTLATAIASGGSAPTLSIDAQVDTNATPGTVTAEAIVDAAENDPDASDNTASADTELVGLPDLIFADGFEPGDIVVVGPISEAIPDDFGGLSINWLTGDMQPGEIANYHFNPYRSNNVAAPYLSFWWGMGNPDAAGVSDGTNYLVLQSGATIGPASNFITTPQAVPTINWRQAGGVDGYLGFRFTNTDTGEVNYGYVHLTTVGTEGFPATVLGYAYNRAGDPITIP